MSPKKGKAVVANLTKRSRNGLLLARQTMMAEKMESPKLQDALEYYLENWNDFTHLGLFSMACEAVGGKPDAALSPQAAIAMMAAAFDIHDDILDKSNFKHKIPTIYGKFGPEIALLLGNGFLIEGFTLLTDSLTVFPKEKQQGVLGKIKQLLFEMGKAHALEVNLKLEKKCTFEDYIRITEMKAAGIEADMYLGVLFGKGTKSECEILANTGRILGILATLRDDLIDIFDIEELRQRMSVRDWPLPLMFAMMNQDTPKSVANITKKGNITETNVAELVDFAFKSEPVIKMEEKMRCLIAQGLKLTNKLPANRSERQIQTLLKFMLEDLQIS
jgi:geranylgeranyl pyrophosphate synthase